MTLLALPQATAPSRSTPLAWRAAVAAAPRVARRGVAAASLCPRARCVAAATTFLPQPPLPSAFDAPPLVKEVRRVPLSHSPHDASPLHDASLAHYLQLFGSEAGSVLPAAADLLHLPRSVHDAMPSAALAPPVVAFLQAAALTVGGGASTALTIALGRTLGVAPGRVAAQCAGIFAAGLLLWPLIVDAPFLQ
jgi:hypothetical protein